MNGPAAPGQRGTSPAASGLVIVDKPDGKTSHDVVARIRKLAGTRRVGHAGTLDPMATGVLVIGVEKATRLLGHLTLTEKEYEGTIRLGQATVTDDAEGEVVPAADGSAVADPSADPSAIPEARLRSALADLTGEISQVPPRISAIKVDGQRAYRLTRSGAEPELTARTVTVSRLDLLDVRQPAEHLLDIDVGVTCSSGTYIRAIARDLGAALGTGGHLVALRRTRVGPYRISGARTLDQLAERFEVIPLAKAAAAAFATRLLTAEEARVVSHGGRLPAADGRRDQASAGQDGDGQASAGQDGDGQASDGQDGDGQASAGQDGYSDKAAAGPPVAAFDPDGNLTALLIRQDDEMQPIAVFVP